MATIVLFAFVSYLALKEYLTIIPTQMQDRIVLFWAYILIPLQYLFVYHADFEMFLVNYLSNVILCTLLLNKGLISRSNELKAFRPRILFISSDSHQDSSYIDYDEFGKFIDYGVKKGISNYSYFKLILKVDTIFVLMMRAIGKMLVPVTG